MTPARFVAAGFGSGFFPVAPGTAGSVVGLAIGTALLWRAPGLLPVAALVSAAAGLWATRNATGLPWRATTKADHDDPGWVVIDEIAGQLCALLPLGGLHWLWIAAAFALFRLLDITKPGPIGWLDRQGGAASIMADDILAGILTAVIIAAARLL